MVARALLLSSCLGLLGCGSAMTRAQGGKVSDVPDANPADYAGRPAQVVLEGKASYYADSLAGNHTANGEIYDPRRLTAASRDLPFGTVARVTRRDNGQHVVVRINDRGPFGDRRRILDLSRAAASELDMLKRGVVDVRVEVLELGNGCPRRCAPANAGDGPSPSRR